MSSASVAKGGARPMRRRSPRTGRWRRPVVLLLLCLMALAGAAFATRRVLLQEVARIALSRDTDLTAQERKDGEVIAFGRVPSGWITPMKNLMNPIWQPIHAQGVNYFTFGAPANVFRTFSERSNPRSPLYQAWVGAYITRRVDGVLPENLLAWASEVTTLDQRSWLSAMGDPAPLADFGAATPAGKISIDGRTIQLWHAAMHSHSDLSEHPGGVLALLLGMPSRSAWPAGVNAFHDVTLDGYFAAWSDPEKKLSVVVYAVASEFAATGGARVDNRAITDQLMKIMQSAKVESAN